MICDDMWTWFKYFSWCSHRCHCSPVKPQWPFIKRQRQDRVPMARHGSWVSQPPSCLRHFRALRVWSNSPVPWQNSVCVFLSFFLHDPKQLSANHKDPRNTPGTTVKICKDYMLRVWRLKLTKAFRISQKFRSAHHGRLWVVSPWSRSW